MRSLLAVAGILIVIFAIRVAAPVVAPLCLAAVLAIALEPVTRGLARRGIPRWCAAVVTNVAILAILGAVAALVLGAASEIIDGLPRYSEALGALEHDVAVWLDTHGLESVATSMGEVDAASRLPVLAEPVLRGTIDIIQTLLLVVIVTAFIQIDAPGLRRTFARRVDARATTREVDDVVDGIQRYVIVKGLISAANGVLLGVWCYLWGVEGAVLWGVLAFALNFIPIVGSLVAAVPPVVLALVLGSPADAAGVAAGYVAVNLVVDNIIEPRVMGRAAGLSPLVVLVAMLFWGFVLGPIGALLSVPLTVVLRAGLTMSPGLRWVALLLDDDAQTAQSRERSSSRRYSDRRSIPSTLAA